MKEQVTALILLLSLPLAAAHLAGGSDVEKNGYLIDFGYQPEQVKAGEKADLVLNLVNATTEEPVKPSEVWVRISTEDAITFSGTLTPQGSMKNIAFSYTFPESGDYHITTRFKGENETLVEHEFELTVQSTGQGLFEKYSWGLPVFIAETLIIIIIVGFLIATRNDQD